MAKHDDKFSPREAKQRFEAALRGSRNVGPKPMKDMAAKRHDPMPENDPDALVAWGKRNIKND